MASEAIEWVKIGLTSAAGGFALWQYAVAQRWKRTEWIVEQMSTFRQTPTVHVVLRAIEWEDRLIEWPGLGKIRVTHVDLSRSLDPDHECNDRDIVIRDSFNDFIEALERFETYVTAGLVSAADLKPFLDFHVAVLAKTDSSSGFQHSFWRYVDRFFSQHSKALSRRLGYPVPAA